MTAPAYPNLVDRALRFLGERGEVDESDLCRHLFGATAGSAGPWARLLGQCLGADDRFVARRHGRWALRSSSANCRDLARLEWVALVVQTDGPKPWRSQVVGLAALCMRGFDPRPRAVWDTAVRPDRAGALPEYLTALGLGARTLAEAPAFGDICDPLLRFVGERPLVGVDVGLAVACLQFALRRAGRAPLTNPLIEVAALAALALGPVAPTGKLEPGRLAGALGLPAAADQRLSARTRLVARIGARLLETAAGSGVTGLDGLLSALADRTAGRNNSLGATRPRLLLDSTGSLDPDRAGAVGDLPEAPGVYIMRDGGSVALYVGKAVNLRRRVGSYFATDLGRTRGMVGLVEATRSIAVLPTATEAEALVLEARLIAEHAPRYNVQQRAGAALVYLRRNPEAVLPRRKGDPRRPQWASAVESLEPGDEWLGPVAPGAGHTLLQTASQRYLLAARRNGPTWPARAADAWAGLADETGGTTVVGGLVASDLPLWALRAPWHGPSTAAEISPLEADERADDAEAPDRTDWASFLGDDWLRGFEPEPGDATASREPDEAAAESSVEAAAPALTVGHRYLLFGRPGWLGSITVGEPATEDVAEAIAAALAAADARPGPTALAELGVALRLAALWPDRVVRLCSGSALPDVASAWEALRADSARAAARVDAEPAEAAPEPGDPASPPTPG